jgi:FtsH-binding integral membrane protein
LPYNVLVTRILALAGAFILAVTVFLVYHSWPVTLLLPLAYLAICFWITRPRSASR